MAASKVCWTPGVSRPRRGRGVALGEGDHDHLIGLAGAAQEVGDVESGIALLQRGQAGRRGFGRVHLLDAARLRLGLTRRASSAAASSGCRPTRRPSTA
jgi:hypothetical protein